MKAPWGALTIERLAAGAIIAISLALALVWVFRVPFFQSPDENTHADYAFTLYSLKGPLPAADTKTGTDVHPLVRYLENVSEFRAIRFNFDGRVAPGYGTSEFYRNVDANAPTVPAGFLSGAGDRVPWVARQYAYLYYALDAVAIGAGSLVGGGSVVAEFFAARLFNVVLLGFSLTLSYLTMRELGVRRALALALLAAIGWLPLTSWMSAYVQPDNFSFTTVALVFYLAVRLRREPADLRSAALLGVALGLLAMTKPHYFVAAALPTLADRTVRFAAVRQAWTKWLAYASLMLGPTIVLAASALALSAGLGHQIAAVVAANGNPLAVAASHGAGALLGSVWTELRDAWASIFLDGLAFVSYWGAISWTGFRISFGPPPLTNFVFDAIGWLSALVFAAMLARTLSVWHRLARLLKSRGALSALRLLVRDVPLNSYILFVVVIGGILVSTGGGLGTQGRYWLPLILPSVLCATRYVTRVLEPPLRRPFAVAFCAALALYSTVAAGAALAALDARFYAPPATLHLEESQARITTFGPYKIDTLIDDGDRDFAASERPRVAGWVVDSRSGLPARGVEFVIDGRRHIPARYGLPFPDVVGRLHDDGLLDTGFSGTLDLRGLASGPHELQLSIQERNRLAPYASRARVSFSIGHEVIRSIKRP